MIGLLGSGVGPYRLAAVILLARAGLRRPRHQHTSTDLPRARLAAGTTAAASLITITEGRL